MQYLQPKQHYIDQYDVHTIKVCLDHYNNFFDRANKERHKFKKYSDKKFENEINKVASYYLNVYRGERHRHKEETITKWMDRDEKMQNLYDNTLPPENIECENCHSSLTLKLLTKSLHDLYDENARMTFIFECLSCHKRQSHYEDGTRWVYEAQKCPKCNSELEVTVKDKDDVMTSIYNCKSCGYKDKDVSDFKKMKSERLAQEKHDKELLKKYRPIFIYTDEEGVEYIRSMDSLKSFMDGIEEEKLKANNPLYQKARSLKKLTVIELQNLLEKSVDPLGYLKLALATPEIDKFVIVQFSVQEGKSDRTENESILVLKKTLKKALEGTNWRLMSAGINYRLGVLTGRLKGYEREEDLVGIVS